MTSPTQRSLGKVRAEGYVAQVVEKFNVYSKTRIDLFGIGDILAMREGEILMVQTTSGSNVAARETKARESEHLSTWFRAGGKFEIHGWRKVGPRGKRKMWKCRVVEIPSPFDVPNSIDFIRRMHGPSRVPPAGGEGDKP